MVKRHDTLTKDLSSVPSIHIRWLTTVCKDSHIYTQTYKHTKIKNKSFKNEKTKQE